MASDEVLTDPFLALAELGGHLRRARAALPPLLRERAQASDDDDEQGPLSRVLDVAQAAVASLQGFAGLRRSFAGGAAIELARSANKVSVVLLGSPRPDDITAFIGELARRDQRLQDATALLGLLLGLCASWLTAGFAPPIVLKTLAERGPQILELGAALCSEAGGSD